MGPVRLYRGDGTRRRDNAARRTPAGPGSAKGFEAGQVHDASPLSPCARLSSWPASPWLFPSPSPAATRPASTAGARSTAAPPGPHPDTGGNNGGGSNGGGSNGGGSNGGGSNGGGSNGGGSNGGGSNGGGSNGGGSNGGGSNGGGSNGGGSNGGGSNGGGNDTKSAFVTVNPRQAYILTSGDDLQDLNAPAVRLSDIGLAPGQPACFRAEGDFITGPNARASKRGTGVVGAVFSRTSDLLNGDNRDRVTGAIDAGPDFTTVPTFLGSVATDISQDFDANDVCLTVPADAQFVFFGINDGFYSDNANIDGVAYGVRVSRK